MLRRLIWACAAVLTLVLAAAILAPVMAARQDRRMEAAWKRELGGRSFSDAFAPQDWNATSDHLQTLAVDLGITFKMKSRSRPGPDPTDDKVSQIKALIPAVSAQLETWRNANSEDLDQLSADVTTTLATLRPSLKRIVELLLREPPPTWERDVAAFWGGADPNLLGPLHLQKLLFLEAGRLLGEEDEVEANRWLEASWRLRQTRLDHPDLVVQLLNLAEIKNLHPMLRRSCSPDAAYRERLRALQWQHRMRVSLYRQAHHFLGASRLAEPIPTGGGFIPTLQRPFARMILRDAARHITVDVDALSAIPTANLDPGEFAQPRKHAWVLFKLYDELVEALAVDLVRAAYEDLNAELTLLVMEERLKGAGEWQSRPSTVVPGVDWRRTRQGRVVSFEPSPIFRHVPTKSSPLRFRVHLNRCQ